MEFDRDVEEFLKALDTSTRLTYKSGLSLFREFYGKPIKDFLDAVEEDLMKPRRERHRVARSILRGFVEWLKDKGYSPKTIRVYVASIQSLARYYDIPVSLRYVNLPPSRTVSEKFAWTLEKFCNFLEYIGNPEVRSIAVTLFQSGLSISDALSLRFRNIKYEYEHNIVPLCLDLFREKTNVHFMTFIGRWGVAMLREHLEGKRLRDDEKIYTVSRRTVDYHFERAGRRMIGSYTGRSPVRPHSLRAAFRTILADHGVDRIYIEFWMGHKLPEQEAVYVSKSREGWRETYRVYAEPWLTPKEWLTNV